MVGLALALCCSGSSAVEPAPTAVAAVPQDPTAAARARMVDRTIEARGVKDARVLAAMRTVPRHLFIPEGPARAMGYEDTPLPIGHEQTISQPYVVAFMTEQAKVDRGDKVLEIGTGSGYQAAVLSEMGAEVYSIEIVEPLARWARSALTATGYPIDAPAGTRGAVHLRTGDGYVGWPEAAPFDSILVTAAPDKVPQPLIDQLAIGGRMVIPVGGGASQDLRVIEKRADGTVSEQDVMPVLFVPMTGKAAER
jgi:protein-L-isoaspartate(D-aspartate) O-methyltransferase